MIAVGKNVNGLTLTETDFIYTNEFKAKVAMYMLKHPDWDLATYRRKTGDRQTRDDAWQDVKNDIKLHGVWDPQLGRIVPATGANIHRIEQWEASQKEPQAEKPPQPQPASPPPPVAPPVAPLSAPVAPNPSPVQDKRVKLDPVLKQLAIDEITKNPDITYAELQAVCKWPALTSAYFSVIKSKIKAKSGSRLPKRQAIGPVAKPISPVVVSSDSLGKEKPKQTLSVMATILFPSEEELPFKYHKVVKGLFANYVKQRLDANGLPDDSDIVLMMDPPCIEIRRKRS